MQGQVAHSHDCSSHECSAAWSLYQHVDKPKVTALNEARKGSAETVIRSWEDRLNFGHVLESNDDDPELIVFIPFTCDVKIRSLAIIGGVEGTSPSSVRAFVNREDIDFSIVSDLTPVQEWTLAEDINGELEYPTKFSRFQGVANITLHFPSNFGADGTKIHFIGFKGEATQIRRDKIASVVYETMPNPQDHKVGDEVSAAQFLQ